MGTCALPCRSLPCAMGAESETKDTETKDTETKVYTYAEVAEHSTREDCWIVVDGKVLDVTKFLDEHPGGDEVMVGVAGQEASDEFEDVGHSTSAAKQIDESVIGEIHPDEKRPPKVIRSSDGGSMASVLMALLVVAAAIYFAMQM